MRNSRPKGKPFEPNQLTASGLPLAKGVEQGLGSKNQNSLFGNQKLPSSQVREEMVAPELRTESLALSASVKESYGGTFAFKSAGSVSEDSRAMILDLEFRGQLITGNATLAGFGAFRVKGNVYARGLELLLFNRGEQIRLTSGPRGTTLRGGYVIVKQNIRGSWQVKRTR